ncbi:hypothetical protein SAMN05444354_11913 [Stigmatella aurantiaca]|uniref:DUF2171 domain-containing protein n=1 Tax=Stigmatella aurantiaca TaxID=41 RepID=A0A1H7ZIS2_STIAU|nr:DUF2171 domain-containing protein [Stigmatella aurantiaca]SEM58215.1 hypothetical protein SAMN05444354_11913 [Stigmatella aurantiaca]
MVDAKQVQPKMPVICSNNVPFARVDHMDGSDTIKLARDENGEHHYIPLSWVQSVDESGIHLDRPGKDAMKQWSTDPLH